MHFYFGQDVFGIIGQFTSRSWNRINDARRCVNYRIVEPLRSAFTLESIFRGQVIKWRNGPDAKFKSRDFRKGLIVYIIYRRFNWPDSIVDMTPSLRLPSYDGFVPLRYGIKPLLISFVVTMLKCGYRSVIKHFRKGSVRGLTFWYVNKS